MKPLKKVLVIVYYWPPSGGSGVQRWLKFVKYMREFGWEPIVYTAENGEYPVIDESLEKEVPVGIEVIRTKIWEPYQIYKKVMGQKKDKKVVSGFIQEKEASFVSKASMWIRGNFFIPDARKFWIKPSVKYLQNYLAEHPVDLIVSSGPPHSVHLIGKKLHQITNIPWVADFRDPWTKISYFDDLMLTKRSERKHIEMEKAVLREADQVIVVGNTMRKEFEPIRGREVKVITNGYDSSDVKSEVEEVLDEKFSIVHIGLIAQSQSHPAFFEALAELKLADSRFAAAIKLVFIGKIDVSVRMLVAKNKLEAQTEYIDYLDHKKAIAYQKRAQVLYLAINNIVNSQAIITGKIFEYLASGRPILCLGPEDGDAAAIVNEASAGLVADCNDKAKIKEHVQAYFKMYLENRLQLSPKGVEKFSRRVLTKELTKIFDEAIKK